MMVMSKTRKRFVQFVDDDGEGTVASNIAGCAERVHCDIEGDDECLSLRRESQYASHRSQGGHHCSAWYARSCNHADAQNYDEMEEQR